MKLWEVIQDSYYFNCHFICNASLLSHTPHTLQPHTSQPHNYTPHTPHTPHYLSTPHTAYITHLIHHAHITHHTPQTPRLSHSSHLTHRTHRSISPTCYVHLTAYPTHDTANRTHLIPHKTRRTRAPPTLYTRAQPTLYTRAQPTLYTRAQPTLYTRAPPTLYTRAHSRTVHLLERRDENDPVHRDDHLQHPPVAYEVGQSGQAHVAESEERVE